MTEIVYSPLTLPSCFFSFSRSNVIFSSFFCNIFVILKKLLADDGVIFVQLNDDEMNYCKVVMDEIFGRKNFINLIAVKTKNSSGASGGGEDRNNCRTLFVSYPEWE